MISSSFDATEYRKVIDVEASTTAEAERDTVLHLQSRVQQAVQDNAVSVDCLDIFKGATDNCEFILGYIYH